MADVSVVNKEKVKNKIKEPRRFKVMVLNDDYTPMDFVIAMLVRVFRHKQSEALSLTLQIHNEGSAVAGVYNYEIAEQKGLEANELARENGHPLQIKVEAV